MKPPFSSKNGFSLIEVIGVIVIILILSAAAVPNILRIIQDQRDVREEKDLATIVKAVKEFIIRNQKIPGTYEHSAADESLYWFNAVSGIGSFNPFQIRYVFPSMTPDVNRCERLYFVLWPQNPQTYRDFYPLFPIDVHCDPINTYLSDQQNLLSSTIPFDIFLRKRGGLEIQELGRETDLPRIMIISSSSKNYPMPESLLRDYLNQYRYKDDPAMRARLDLFWNWDGSEIGLNVLNDHGAPLENWFPHYKCLHVARINLAELFCKITFTECPENAVFRISTWYGNETIPCSAIGENGIAVIKGTKIYCFDTPENAEEGITALERGIYPFTNQRNISINLTINSHTNIFSRPELGWDFRFIQPLNEE